MQKSLLNTITQLVLIFERLFTAIAKKIIICLHSKTHTHTTHTHTHTHTVSPSHSKPLTQQFTQSDRLTVCLIPDIIDDVTDDVTDTSRARQTKENLQSYWTNKLAAKLDWL